LALAGTAFVFLVRAGMSEHISDPTHGFSFEASSCRDLASHTRGKICKPQRTIIEVIPKCHLSFSRWSSNVVERLPHHPKEG
jgi:hypothetical protein